MKLPLSGIHLGFPLLRRELIGLLRTRRAFWLLLITVAVSCLLPLLAWPSAERSAMAWRANIEVFLTFILTQLSLALLVIPAFTAGSISGERERGTYDLLYTTLLSPSSIVLSKVLASTGYVLILLVATAPAVCVLHLLGGFDFTTLLKCHAVSFAAIFMSGLVCLAQSMRSKRTSHAVVRGIIWVVLYNGGLMLLLLLGILIVSLGGQPFFGAEELVYMLFCMSPYGAIPLEVEQTALLRGWPGLAAPWLLFVMYALLISSKQLWTLLRGVRTPDVPASRIVQKLGAAFSPGIRRHRKVRRSWTARLLIHLGENGALLLRSPVFLKEIRSEFFSRTPFRATLYWVPLLVFAGLGMIFSEASQDFETWITTVSIVTLGLLLLLTPGVASSSFTREIEQGNLDFLRGTLIPMKKVYSGKLLASLYSTSGVPLAAATVLGVGLVLAQLDPRPRFGDDIPEILFYGLVAAVVIAVALVFTTTLASLASLLFTRTLPALLAAYAAVAAINIIPPIFLEAQLTGRDEKLWMGATNPFACVAYLQAPFLRSYGLDGLWELLGMFLEIHLTATAALWWISRWLAERLRAREQ